MQELGDNLIEFNSGFLVINFNLTHWARVCKNFATEKIPGPGLERKKEKEIEKNL